MGVSVGPGLAGGSVLSACETAPPRTRPRPPRRFGLSARLFLITIALVVLAEVVIYIPAVALFRRDWLADRLSAAQVAAFVLDAVPDQRVEDVVAGRLLAGVGARAILVRGDGRVRLLAPEPDGNAQAASEAAPAVATVDLRRTGLTDLLASAWRTFTLPADATIRVIGHAGREAAPDPGRTIEIFIDEGPLQQAVAAFSLRLLASSLVVAGTAALIVFLALQRLLVRPVRRLARNIGAFADDPENAERVILPSGRQDEIGDAERALAGMQKALAGVLRHKRRLADLGLSVSKIHHDLRNLLTTAQLLGDRLDGVADPVVQRVAPRLVATLDRASRFCEATLAYGRAAERHPLRRMVPLRPILAELPDLAALARGRAIDIRLDVPADLLIDVDAEQLARVLRNLVRNAVQALAAEEPRGPDRASPHVTVAARREGQPGAGRVDLTVTDNGPGLPERARTHLFTPFQGSMRAGGTGLGLAIAAELTELNGGTLRLDPTGAGTCFRLVVPDRAGAAA